MKEKLSGKLSYVLEFVTFFNETYNTKQRISRDFGMNGQSDLNLGKNCPKE